MFNTSPLPPKKKKMWGNKSASETDEVIVSSKIHQPRDSFVQYSSHLSRLNLDLSDYLEAVGFMEQSFGYSVQPQQSNAALHLCLKRVNKFTSVEVEERGQSQTSISIL
jgi:hypothetical protein